MKRVSRLCLYLDAIAITHLQTQLLDRLVTSNKDLPDGQETSNPDVIRCRRPKIEQQLQQVRPLLSAYLPRSFIHAATHLQVRPDLPLSFHHPGQHFRTLRDDRVQQTVRSTFNVLVSGRR